MEKCVDEVGANIDWISPTGLLVLNFDQAIQAPAKSKELYEKFEDEA